MSDYENFVDAPLSIDELRAARTNRSVDMLPRSCLIEILRQIDRGEIEPETLVLAWSSKVEEGHRHSGWTAAGPDMLVQLGLLDLTARKMLKSSDNE